MRVTLRLKLFKIIVIQEPYNTFPFDLALCFWHFSRFSKHVWMLNIVTSMVISGPIMLRSILEQLRKIGQISAY